MDFYTFDKHDYTRLSFLQPQGWSDITDAFKFYSGSPFCYPIKAMANGDIAGVGAAIIFDRTAWLAHIIVHRDHRNKGIGGAIVGHLMDLAKGKGCGTVSLVATELGRLVYLKAGFVDQTDYVFFKREQATPEKPCPHGVSELGPDDRGQILEMDRELSGEWRQALFEGKWEGALVHRGRDGVDGYYIPALGEGLVMAENDRAGLALLSIKLGGSVKIVLPAENTAGIAFIKDNGFAEASRSKRMVWGPPFPWRPERLYHRIAGNVG